MENCKMIRCPECGANYIVFLKIGELEYLDGYHGECPMGFCGYWHFESLVDNNEIQSDAESGGLDSDTRLPKDVSDFRYHNNKRR